jgi:hypothetical protein
MGIFVRSPQLSGAESVLWKKAANRTQGGRSVGGRLYLTDTRLIFQPNRFDAVTKGHPWSVPLAGIESVSTEAPDGSPFSGGLRTRLRLDLSDGDSAFFVINGIETAVQKIQEGIGPKV